LLVIALGMTAVLSWYAGDDLLFALRAERVQAKVSGWSVTMTFRRVDPPQAIAAARTRVAPVPRVDLTLPGPDARRCIAQGRRAVFGLREIESEQQMKDALAGLQLAGSGETFVRRRGAQSECRLSRAVDPWFTVFWLATTLFTSAVAISMWRARIAEKLRSRAP
jgi:hypothetical protein